MEITQNTTWHPIYSALEKFLNILLFDQAVAPKFEKNNYTVTDFSLIYNIVMKDGRMINPNIGIQHFTNAVANFFLKATREDTGKLIDCYFNSNTKLVIETIIDNQKSAYLGLSKFEITNLSMDDIIFATMDRLESTPQIFSYLVNQFAELFFKITLEGSILTKENYDNLLRYFVKKITSDKAIENSVSPLFSEISETLKSFTEEDIKNHKQKKFLFIKYRITE